MKRAVILAAIAVSLVAILVILLGDSEGKPSETTAAPQALNAEPKPRRSLTGSADGTEPASCSGRVSSSAEPVSGALVCAHGSTDCGLPTGDIECRRTDAQGFFAFDEVEPGQYRFVAAAPGYRPLTPAWPSIALDGGRACEPLDLRLTAGGLRVAGTVVDLTGGVIEGAFVSFLDPEGRPSSMVTTDRDGGFELWAGSPRGSLAGRAEGYSHATMPVAAPVDGVELRLLPASSISGRVISDATGAPIARALITAFPVQWAGRDDGAKPASTRSDEDRFFEVSDLGTGSYWLTARSEDGVGRSPGAVSVPLATSVEDIELRIHLAASIAGRVLMEDSGEPCRAGRVTLVDDDSGYAQSADIAANGEVQFALPIEGSFAVVVDCEGARSSSDFPKIDTSSQPAEKYTWTVDRGAAVTGRVVDAQGTAVPAAEVEATPVRASGAAGAESATTNEDGTFVVSGLERAPYRLRARATGFAEMVDAVTVTAPNDDVDLVLERGGVVQGVVVDRAGEPVDSMSVVLAPGHRSSRWSYTSTDGTFFFDQVPAGRCTVAVADRTRRPLFTADGSILEQDVQVANDETAELQFVIDRPSGTISGKVIRADGSPETRAYVTAVREFAGGPDTWGGVRSSAALQTGSIVDLDGSFELSGLVDGRYTVLAQVRGEGREASLEHVETGSDITLEIAAPASLSGRVTPGAGTKMPEYYLLQLANQDNGWRHAQSYLGGELGQWSVPNVPAGTYVVSVRSAAGSGTAKVEVSEGEDETGVNITLESDSSIAGRVVSLEDERPLPGFRVVATSANAGIRSKYTFADRRNISGADGRFRVTSPPSGRVTLHVIPEFLDDRDPTLTQAHLTYDIVAGQPNPVGDIPIPANRLPNNETPGDFGFGLGEWDHEVDQATLSTKVVTVRPGSPAAASGVRVGDELVRMDEHPVGGNGRYIYEYRKRVAPGTTAEFEFSSGLVVELTAR